MNKPVSSPEGFMPLVPGASMRRLSSKSGEKFCELLIEDPALLESLKDVLNELTAGNQLEPAQIPVSQRVLKQADEEQRRQPDGHHILLPLEEAGIFFQILADLKD